MLRVFPPFAPLLPAGGGYLHLYTGIFPRRVAPAETTAGRFSPEGEGTVIPTELEREAILEALAKIALSRPNDAIALALDPERKRVGAMDLWGVAEFKRAAGGAVEVKFADRAKAVSLLLEALGGGEDGMGALLEALGNCGPEGSNSAWE